MKKLLILTLLGALSVLQASGQVTPTTIIVLTNLPATIAGGSTSNLFAAGTIPTTDVISLRQGQGFASSMTYNGTNAATTLGFSINWAVSLDGTNWQTSGFLQTTNAANGTNTCTTVTNFSSALVNNALLVAPYSIQNANAATNNIALGSVIVSFGNIVPGGYP